MEVIARLSILLLISVQLHSLMTVAKALTNVFRAILGPNVDLMVGAAVGLNLIFSIVYAAVRADDVAKQRWLLDADRVELIEFPSKFLVVLVSIHCVYLTWLIVECFPDWFFDRLGLNGESWSVGVSSLLATGAFLLAGQWLLFGVFSILFYGIITPRFLVAESESLQEAVAVPHRPELTLMVAIWLVMTLVLLLSFVIIRGLAPIYAGTFSRSMYPAILFSGLAFSYLNGSKFSDLLRNLSKNRSVRSRRNRIILGGSPIGPLTLGFSSRVWSTLVCLLVTTIIWTLSIRDLASVGSSVNLTVPLVVFVLRLTLINFGVCLVASYIVLTLLTPSSKRSR